jgi:formylglycine-generating enzyme required for sulfatase activity
MPRRRCFGLVLAIGILGPSLLELTAQTQQAAEAGGKRYALLVGVQDYDVNELHNLNFAQADVTALANTLREGGYDARNIVLMTQSVGATKARFLPLAQNIRKELDLLLGDLDRDDAVFIAFAGHGIQFQGEEGAYFCPMDAKLTDRSTLIAFKDVYAKLEKCGAGLKVLMVDACRNDPRTKTARARAEVDLESITRPQVIPPPGGVLAFFGCSAGEKTQENEELQHGVFFYFVNQGLKGEADLDHDNQVSPEELAQYAKKRVRDFVREKNGIRQMPELVGTTRDVSAIVAIRPEIVRPELITTKTAGIKLKLIPAGRFLMGSRDGEGDDDEHPQHEVRITRPFYLGLTEVTQGQYETLMGNNPSYFSAHGDHKDRIAGQSTEGHPVENVSWLDAVKFCNKLSEKEGLKLFYEIEGDSARVLSWEGVGYRLPTEAEWEYACRAGAQTRFSFGDAEGGLGEYGWFDGNSGDVTHPVGQRRSNQFGLFDMHGNDWEWCNDVYAASYYKQSPADDPRGPDPAEASRRVIRGGGWFSVAGFCRSAGRGRRVPAHRSNFLGFRLARGQSRR